MLFPFDLNYKKMSNELKWKKAHNRLKLTCSNWWFFVWFGLNLYTKTNPNSSIFLNRRPRQFGLILDSIKNRPNQITEYSSYNALSPLWNYESEELRIIWNYFSKIKNKRVNWLGCQATSYLYVILCWKF